ncbi:MAG: DEAD/DEAH box helicase [Lentisphaeria bacterium]|nr:DEAD/DEAH box helicase [Lentisphaeria bacterium]
MENQIKIDADLDRDPGFAILRFYDLKTQSKAPMRMQRLHNLCMRNKRSPEKFSKSDQRVLTKIQKHVSRPAILKQNLLALRIPQTEFDQFRTKQTKTHSISNQKTGAKIQATIKQAELEIEIRFNGEFSLLGAYVKSGPHRQAWNRVNDSYHQARKEIAIHEETYKIALPLDVHFLNKVFGHDNPRVPSKAIPHNLPQLINHRLDLLTGDVEIRRNKTSPILILEEKEGKILIQGNLNSAKSSFYNAKILLKNRKFHIIEEDVFIPEELKRVRDNFLRNLKLDSMPRAIAARPSELRILGEFLKDLNGLVQVKSSPTLSSLIKGPLPTKVMIQVAEQNNYIHLNYQYCAGESVFSKNDLQAGKSIFRDQAGKWIWLEEALSKGDLEEKPKKIFKTDLLNFKEQIQSQNFIRYDQTAIEQLAKQHNTDICIDLSSSPQGIKLRPYQKQGIEFCTKRLYYQTGVLLADDMGLGKTIQTLAIFQNLQNMKQLEDPTLILCPASLSFVWKNEIQKYFPDINATTVIGPASKRKQLLSQKSSIFITSYHSYRQDIKLYQKVRWSFMILDEAHMIKNPETQIAYAVKSLESPFRIALTGTPIENNIMDLWSIMDFLNPKFWETANEFSDKYKKSQTFRAGVKADLQRFMIRRNKSEVSDDLPDKTIEVLPIPFNDHEQHGYIQLHNNLKEKSDGSFTSLLASLTRLRQYCCHPALISQEYTNILSTKLAFLLDKLEELTAKGHSVLVFSQFTKMLELIQSNLEAKDISNLVLTGKDSASQRSLKVEKFQNSREANVFLLSLKAAGTGLTLHKADYVFIFDPWWNPAAEMQAIDRAHRIGQQNKVFAYKLIMSQTIEEKVLKLQSEKQKLFEEVIENGSSQEQAVSMDDLRKLLFG